MVDNIESLDININTLLTKSKLENVLEVHSIKYKKRLSKDKLIELIKENVNNNVIEIDWLYNFILDNKKDNPKIINPIWEHIINVNNIDLTKYLQIITAKEIKESKETWNGKNNQFEPRLICKIDKIENNPKIFNENNISVLSIKNGNYLLIKENIYKNLEKEECNIIDFNKTNNSVLLNIGNSESNLLDNMLYNGIIEDIIGEPVKYGPLMGGRHYCDFNTIIGNENIHIKGSQYETDACYETDNYICICEAKNTNCNNFNIRQLYYPFREVYKIEKNKEIICLFIYKDKDKIINVHKYKWNNPKNMLDIIQINYYRYSLQ